MEHQPSESKEDQHRLEPLIEISLTPPEIIIEKESKEDKNEGLFKNESIIQTFFSLVFIRFVNKNRTNYNK